MIETVVMRGLALFAFVAITFGVVGLYRAARDVDKW